ncbi:MAG: magnesium transporter CorA family protein [Desulfotomaculales bacterium]
MLRVFLTEGDKLTEHHGIGLKGSWILLVNPTQEEKERVGAGTGIPLDFLEYPLDEEERSRIEFGDQEVLVIIRIPVARGEIYDTIPLGVIITDACVVTVCLDNNPVLDELRGGRMRGFYTFKKTRFLLHILYLTAALYLRYLREIDRKSEAVRHQLQLATRNEELFRLLDLGKSLVYITTSLRSNEIVMEKLLRTYLAESSNGRQTDLIKMYEEDRELLEDVIVENKQALEMGQIYTSILNSMMDAFASIISNNLNIVMKFLTGITIVLMIPTMVASFYGMNVPLPGQHAPHAFAGLLAVSATAAAVTIWVLRRKQLF